MSIINEAEKKQVIENIQKWLTGEKVPFNPVADRFASFNIVVQASQGRTVNVLINDDALDILIIGTRAIFSEDNLRKLRRVNSEDKDFMWNLKFDLLNTVASTGVQFFYEPETLTDANQLRSIKFQKIVFFDGLTKGKFFDSIQDVLSTFSIANAKLGKAFGTSSLGGTTTVRSKNLEWQGD